MSNFIFYNGQILPATEPVLEAGNRVFQYGDGLFETMRICNGKLILGPYHFDRLFSGMQALMMKIPMYFKREYLQEDILKLCSRNGHPDSARVRLTVFRKSISHLNDEPDQPSILIESWPLDDQYIFWNDAFAIDVYPDARKSMDGVAAYKTTAYLPYALAAVFARLHGLNDCLVLNAAGNVCDSSIANVFLIKDAVIYTPPLSEGCVEGVMRRYLINKLEQVREAPVNVEMLLSADEIFLTNVIRGIQPVTNFRVVHYNTIQSKTIFDKLIAPLTIR